MPEYTVTGKWKMHWLNRAVYDNLPSVDPYALYWIKDQNIIFRGDKPLLDNFAEVSEFVDPYVGPIKPKTLCYKISDVEGQPFFEARILNEQYGWDTVVPPVNGVIEKEGTEDKTIPTSNAVRTFVTDRLDELREYFDALNNSMTEKLERAQQAAVTATDAAADANVSADDSFTSAIKSESYAVGGTDSRPGEDTDNAKWYKQKAEEAASQGGGSAEEARQYAEAAAQSASEALDSEHNAATSETNAAASERAAAQSEANASASETAAQLSEHNSAASETAAHNSEVAAKASEDAAALSEQHAATSETNAHNSEVAAKQSEQAAASSETNAHNSEVAAKQSEQNAATSETNAHNSEVAAKASENAAKLSEQNAASSESNASTSETNAHNSEVAAATSETNAHNSEVAAAASATAALSSEGKAKTSETNAKASENAAKLSETNAHNSEVAAAGSAAAALTSEQHSLASEQAAAGSASAALTSEQHALASEQAASGSAANALASEQHAATSETNASNSAADALTSEQHASASETAAANSATLAESWAVGGTDTREGEDENNAKYYAELAEHFSPAGKADKPNPLPEVNGNVAALTTEGNLLDTGIPSDNVAKKDGNYQEEGLHSATAGNLIDQNATPVEASFSFRTAAGEVSITDDSNGVIDKFKGTTQIQNQLVHDTNQNTKSSVDGKLSVSDAIGGNVSKMLVKGGCVVHNQLVKESVSKTTSGTGRLGCSDGVAGNAESFVITAPKSVVMNQWIDTGDTEVTLANGRIWLTYIGGVSSKVSGTGQSVPCSGGTDMAVDLTQYFNGDTTLINSITFWDDLVAYDPSFASYVAYNTGTVKGVQPTVKVNHTTDVACPVELFGVSDTVGDSFDGVSGVVTREVGSYTFTGQESFTRYTGGSAYDGTQYVWRFAMPVLSGANKIILAGYIGVDSAGVVWIQEAGNNKHTVMRIDNSSISYLYIRNDACITSADMAAELTGKTVFFVLAAPTTEQYTSTTIPTLNIYNNAVQTSNERLTSLSMMYQGREQTIALDPTHTYVFNDNQVGDSLVTNESSINVIGGEDMLVDLTQFYNGDISKISQIQRWKSLSSRYHRYRDFLPYNAGTVEPETPVIHVYPDEYAYGVVYNPNQTLPACQKVVLRNGVITEVEDFTEMPCHQLYRCVMDNLGTRHIAYYLDDEDSNKKYNGTRNGVTSDGSASVLTGVDGDVMVEIPISYWYLDEDYNGEGKYLWLISDRPFMGTHGSAEIHDYFYVSPDGATCRTQYVGAYRASVCNEDGTPINTTEGAYSQATGTSSTNKARSIAGALPYVNVNQNDLRTRAIRNNSGSTVNSKFHQWLFILMMIEKGSLNTQSISAGYSNGISNANYCFWRKSGRVNAGNGTNQLYAVEGTQDMDNFQSFKIGSTTVQRDTLKDADGRYAWSVNSRGSTTTRYFTDSPTPSNGNTVYSASTGDTSAGTVSSYTLKTGRVIQFQYRGIENPFGEVWEFEHGIQKYCHAFTSSIKANNVVYNRDPVNNGSNSLAWTKADGTVTVWTPRSLTNAHTYTDPDLTQDTGYAVTVNGYYYDLRGYYETLSTSDYTGTEQATANNPTYTWKRHRWPIGSNYIKTFDPLTFFVLTTPGSATTYLPDYYYDNVGTGSRVVFRGGPASYGAYDGLGYVYVNYGLTYSFVNFSGRLSA